MALNSYFLQGSQSEQRLVQDLINEQLKIFGVEVTYLPRKIVKKDTIFRELESSTFNDNFAIEAYVNTYEGYTGAGDIMTKFGILGNQSKEKVMYSPDQYTRIENPTVCHELESVIEEVKKGVYDIHKQKVITVSECHRLSYGGNNSCSTGKCGCKKRNSDGNIHCGKNCGCIKNGSLCGSLCKCSETCPNRSSH